MAKRREERDEMKRREETEQAERLRQKIVQQQRRKQEEEQRQEKKRMEAEKIRQAAEAEASKKAEQKRQQQQKAAEEETAYRAWQKAKREEFLTQQQKQHKQHKQKCAGDFRDKYKKKYTYTGTVPPGESQDNGRARAEPKSNRGQSHHSKDQKGSSSSGSTSWPRKNRESARLTPSQVSMLIKQHERTWARFVEGTETITWEDVAWPSLSGGDETMIQHMLRCRGNAADRVKELRLRWHPDKFQQMFAHRLCENSSEQIMKRVNEIAGMINELAASKR